MKKIRKVKISLILILTIIMQIFALSYGRVYAEDVYNNNTTTKTSESEEKVTKEIYKLKIKVSAYIHTYDGRRKEAEVKIYDGKKKLTQNKDYEITYSNNVKPGKAKVLITGIGDYTGKVTRYFYIAPKKTQIKSIIMNYNFTKATITWNKDSLASGYRIYMSTSENGKYTRIKTITNNKITSYRKSGLNPNRTYYFKIRAYVEIGGQRLCKKYGSPKANTGLVAKITLNSPKSGSARNWNLNLASKKINGTVLKPGQTFNWFKIVGPANKSRGFKDAIIFVNHKSVLGSGGGICQVSTTLFQAARKAGLKIVERHTHSKAVSYTTSGNDATVSYGSKNLKFKNNKKYTIKLNTYSKGGKTVCKIYHVVN